MLQNSDTYGHQQRQ